MKQNSKRLFSMLIGLVLIVAAFIVYLDFISSAYSNVQTIKGQVLAGQQSLDTEQKVIDQAQKSLTQYKNQSQAQAELAESLPSGPDVTGALAQVYGIASSEGIVVQGISVSSPPIRSSSKKKSASVELIKPMGTVTLQITAAGSYESFKNFLSDLETNLRIFDLQALSITSQAPASEESIKNGTEADPDFFTYNLTVATYYQAD